MASDDAERLAESKAAEALIFENHFRHCLKEGYALPVKTAGELAVLCDVVGSFRDIPADELPFAALNAALGAYYGEFQRFNTLRTPHYTRLAKLQLQACHALAAIGATHEAYIAPAAPTEPAAPTAAEIARAVGGAGAPPAAGAGVA